MADRYHIDINGVSAKCNADVRVCPRGGAQYHFSTKEESDTYADFLNELEVKLEKPKHERFSIEEAKERAEIIEKAMKNPLMDRFNTRNFYYNSTVGEWSEERNKQHEEILNDFMEGFKDIPKDKKVLISAGLPGAGKTTVLKQIDEINIKEYATINADDIKEAMVEKGMVPEIRGLTPLEGAGLIHEESSYLADTLQKRLAKEGTNVIYDMTCKTKSSVERRMAVFENSGYKLEDTTMVFVDIELDTSKERAYNRYMGGLNDYIDGKSPSGGRYVPDVVFESCKPTWDNTNSINQEVFKTYQMDKNNPMTMIEYDNNVNGRMPIRIS